MQSRAQHLPLVKTPVKFDLSLLLSRLNFLLSVVFVPWEGHWGCGPGAADGSGSTERQEDCLWWALGRVAAQEARQSLCRCLGHKCSVQGGTPPSLGVRAQAGQAQPVPGFASRALHPGLCIPRSLRGGCGDTASPPPDPLNSTGQSRSALGQNVLISCFSSPAGTWPVWSPAVPRVLCKAAGAAGGFQRQQSSSLPWSCHSSHLISWPALFLKIPFLTCLVCLI